MAASIQKIIDACPGSLVCARAGSTQADASAGCCEDVRARGGGRPRRLHDRDRHSVRVQASQRRRAARGLLHRGQAMGEFARLLIMEMAIPPPLSLFLVIFVKIFRLMHVFVLYDFFEASKSLYS